MSIIGATKGQITSKGLLEFSQKTNKRIRFFFYDEFVCSFFGRIQGYQKVLSKFFKGWKNRLKLKDKNVFMASWNFRIYSASHLIYGAQGGRDDFAIQKGETSWE